MRIPIRIICETMGYFADYQGNGICVRIKLANRNSLPQTNSPGEENSTGEHEYTFD
jgi:hypothetical protein